MLMSEGGAVASRARKPSHATGLIAVWIEQCGFRGPCPSVTTKHGGSTVAVWRSAVLRFRKCKFHFLSFLRGCLKCDFKRIGWMVCPCARRQMCLMGFRIDDKGRGLSCLWAQGCTICNNTMSLSHHFVCVNVGLEAPDSCSPCFVGGRSKMPKNGAVG